VEVMVKLANLVGASPWFAMPHTADDDYHRKFAAQVLPQHGRSPGTAAQVLPQHGRSQVLPPGYCRPGTATAWAQPGTAARVLSRRYHCGTCAARLSGQDCGPLEGDRSSPRPLVAGTLQGTKEE
jgi:hypothetical protein